MIDFKIKVLIDNYTIDNLISEHNEDKHSSNIGTNIADIVILYSIIGIIIYLANSNLIFINL